MSIRISADNQRVYRTANMPSITNFTLLGKSYVVSDRTSSHSQHFFSMSSTLQNNGFAIRMVYGDFSDNLTLFTYDGTANRFVDISAGAARPATGRWILWYCKCAGTGANQLEAGWGYCDSTAAMTTGQLQLAALNTDVVRIEIGNLAGQATEFWGDMRHQYIGLFDTVWTAAQLNRQRYRRAMVNKASVNFWIPGVDATLANAVKDFSGNGRDLSSTATPTIEANVSLPIDQNAR